jgi:hypothetical protein
MIVAGRHGWVLVGGLRLLDEGREMAWAEKHLRRDPDIGWVLGNYVEADNANDNGHIFPLEDLRAAQQTLVHKPLNMLHQSKYVVGSFIAAEMIVPDVPAVTYTSTGSSSATASIAIGSPNVNAAVVPMTAAGTLAFHPVLEGLAAFWRHNFPEEYELVRRAQSEGAAFFSMEAVPKQLACVAEGCGVVADYVGRASDTYCEHMAAPSGKKRLIQPHFNAGAIIVPPIRPGWKRADINEISRLLEEEADMAERVYADLEHDYPHLGPKEWESTMALVMLEARDVSTKERQRLAKEGKAMPGGRYPIANAQDLKNAIQAYGRGKPSDKPAIKRHIIRRAKALGLTDLLPEGWT